MVEQLQKREKAATPRGRRSHKQSQEVNDVFEYVTHINDAHYLESTSSSVEDGVDEPTVNDDDRAKVRNRVHSA